MTRMLKLRKAEISALDEFIALLRGAGHRLLDAIQAHNTSPGDSLATLEQLVEEYNVAVQAAEEFRLSIQEAQEASWDSCTERWQGSEAGDAYKDWMELWGEELPELELDLEDGATVVEVPELEALQKLENLPAEP